MMSKKNLGVDKNGIQKTMRFKDYFSDGCGQGATNLIVGLAAQLSYFYTEKVGVAAAVVSIALLISKILDAFTDIPMGRIIDVSKNPKGKCKPWFLYVSFPFAVVLVLVLMIPKNMAEIGQLIYILVTNVLLTAVLYTAFSVPYGAIVNLRTQSADERSNISLTRTIFSYVFGAIVSMTVIPVTNALGGTQSAWIKYGIVCGLVGCLMLLICYKGAREDDGINIEKQPDEVIPMKEGMSKLLHNKYWVIILIASVASQAAYGLSSSAGTYYAKYVYGNDNLTAVTSGVGMLGLIAGFVLSKPMLKKFGLSKMIMISSIYAMGVGVFMMFNPRFFWANVILNTISQTFTIASTIALGVLQSFTIEYNEYLYNNRLLGISGSLAGFSNKVGNGVGVALVTAILAITGYSSSAEVMPDKVIYGIFAFSIYLPFIINGIKLICAVKCKGLEKEYGNIVMEIRKRNVGK